MIAIQNTLVSDQIFTECFCCDLQKCKGCCCIEGDAGAPLEKDEIPLLAKYYPAYREYMTEAGRAVVEDGRYPGDGRFYEVFPLDGSLLTPLVGNRDCVYLTPPDRDGVSYCAIEQAFREGRIPFRKPVSCAMFPIRVQHFPEYDALNYFQWDICADAVKLGRKGGIPVFRFLQEPLTDAYGEEWFREAEAVYEALFSKGGRG